MLRALSLLVPHGCCGAAVVSDSEMEKKLLFFNFFIAVPSIIASSFFIGQCHLMLCSTSFMCSQPCITYAFSFCRCVFSHDAVCMSSMDVQTGMSTEMLIVHLCSFLQFLCGCCWTSSLCCAHLGQVCIRCATCNGVFLSLYTVTSETAWPHLC